MNPMERTISKYSLSGTPHAHVLAAAVGVTMSGNGDEEGARWLLGVRDTVVDTWQEYDPDLYDDLATDSIYDRPPSSLGVWTVWRDLQLWQHDEAMAEAFPHMGDDPTELARRALNFVGRYLVRQVLASLQEEYR